MLCDVGKNIMTLLFHISILVIGKKFQNVVSRFLNISCQLIFLRFSADVNYF